MNQTHVAKIASELKLREVQVLATARLLEEDATIPFIARYRKEATGSLDEIAITAIRDRLHQLQELDKRRESILASLEERDLLTDELREKITAAESMPVLEDMYLPFRPKRRTRAAIAREKGLEPLAQLIFAQGTIDPLSEANKFIDAIKGVETIDHAIQGARDIIAEWVSEDQAARGAVRKLFEEKGTLRARVAPGKQEAAVKYRDYYEWEEGIAKIPSHRLLATMRGESEGLLTLHILPEEKDALAMLEKQFVKNRGPAAEQVSLAVHDGYKRLLASSMENELRASAKQKADEEAIRVFAENLRQLLLAPPLGQKRIMGIDPGFRTGCKVVCLDRQGKLLQNDTIYPHPPHNQKDKAAEIISTLCEKCSVEVIAIGDGTAGRETYDFVRSLNPAGDGTAVMVDEDGASVYSASPSAQEEFPDHDLTVRGAVSIGRRLMDPLAELVKIEPKSIGVGQYQHDVDQKLLKKKLDEVVMSCVNMVGVELNTASKQLLSYVSGLSPKRAQNIIDYRNDQGPFTSRDELTAVPGLGPKAFEQAAGFLRIRDGNNPLDASAVHPESYHIVEKMAHDLASTVTDLMRDERLRKKIDLNQYVTATAGLPTLNDIMQELSKPGRDPRDTFVAFSYAEGIHRMEDLKVGMKLPGIVTNITNFGAFIDIGVHQDGLVHISELADAFVKNPAAVVKLHQKVDVTVINVDSARKRISLSMKSTPGAHTGTGSDRRKL
jgi:protein Tex